MFPDTASRLKCPNCPSGAEKLTLFSEKSGASQDILSGHLKCESCKSLFPILSGVAILVPDVGEYLFTHAKGILREVKDSEIPAEFLEDFLAAKQELADAQPEHIEEDLEAERVIALYFINHYLKATDSPHCPSWWKPQSQSASGSPLIDSLIREHWDQGPFSVIAQWTEKMSRKNPAIHALELGCGVGGLFTAIQSYVQSYLGVDSSFASIALARHLILGAPYNGKLAIPGDLLNGVLSRRVDYKTDHRAAKGAVDFVVGDIENPPVQQARWDWVAILNAMDMLQDPASLPALQSGLLTAEGSAIQSCPYIWHQSVAERLKEVIPREITDSAQAVEWLYKRAGFKIENRVEHLPWLFFKHLRQMEVYSVHLLEAKKEF